MSLVYGKLSLNEKVVMCPHILINRTPKPLSDVFAGFCYLLHIATGMEGVVLTLCYVLNLASFE